MFLSFWISLRATQSPPKGLLDSVVWSALPQASWSFHLQWYWGSPAIPSTRNFQCKKIANLALHLVGTILLTTAVMQSAVGQDEGHIQMMLPALLYHPRLLAVLRELFKGPGKSFLSSADGPLSSLHLFFWWNVCGISLRRALTFLLSVPFPITSTPAVWSPSLAFWWPVFYES